ncbi:MAG: hypothetical protein HY655_14580 [Acidobacteria bacterium]|nr:hypothetical protein [Acidobacteriota bacterium]
MRTLVVVLIVLGSIAPAGAQTPAPATQPPTSTGAGQAAPAAPAPPAPPESFTYDPAGRRDPFLNLLNSGGDTRPSGRGEGPSALTVAEISVRGILQSRGALIAMVKGPDNKTYVMHQGDKLLDGTIKSITPQGLIILQEVNDPLSLVKQREVRKMLREDGKE